jgi:hypothetical protein
VTHGSTGAPLLGRQSPESWDTWQHQSSPLKKAEHRAMGHVAAPKLPLGEGKVRSCGTHDSTGAHLSKEESSGSARHVAALEPTFIGR